MFDSLRDPPKPETSLDADTDFAAEPGFDAPTASPTKPFLGLTPVQRLILAIMLLASVCILGTLCLLITGRIGLG